jgi:hypothetical protein
MIIYREVSHFCIYSYFIVNSLHVGAIGGSKNDDFFQFFFEKKKTLRVSFLVRQS